MAILPAGRFLAEEFSFFSSARSYPIFSDPVPNLYGTHVVDTILGEQQISRHDETKRYSAKFYVPSRVLPNAFLAHRNALVWYAMYGYYLFFHFWRFLVDFMSCIHGPILVSTTTLQVIFTSFKEGGMTNEPQVLV